jgi:hypothetical protein
VGGEVVHLGHQAAGEGNRERRSPSSLAEVVGVHPLHFVGALQRYAHAVVDHEVGEHLPGDQDHLVRESFGVLSSGPVSRQYSHDLRLERAWEHLQCLEAECRTWLEEHPYRVYGELDAERRNKLVKVEIFHQPPAELGLLIGDCLHNMRSALDNLVYDLAIAHRGSPLSRSIARVSQFPIFKDCDQFTDKGMDQIRGIHPDAKAVIKRLQPYHRGEKSAYHRLWMLRELSNADKHRLLHPTLLQPAAMGFFPDEVDLSDITWKLGPVENGAEIARYPYSGEEGAEMDVKAHFTFRVGFRQGSPLPILPTDILNTMDVASVLKWIYLNITKTFLPPLVPFLNRH